MLRLKLFIVSRHISFKGVLCTLCRRSWYFLCISGQGHCSACEGRQSKPTLCLLCSSAPASVLYFILMDSLSWNADAFLIKLVCDSFLSGSSPRDFTAFSHLFFCEILHRLHFLSRDFITCNISSAKYSKFSIMRKCNLSYPVKALQNSLISYNITLFPYSLDVKFLVTNDDLVIVVSL